MNIPFLDLKIQLEDIKSEILKEINNVIDSGRYILGPKVEELEKDISNFCSVKHSIGVSSGTDALLVSLMALNINKDDIVITTPFSFFSTVEVISRLGARPVFIDIDPNTYNIDPEKLEDFLMTGISGCTTKQRFDISKVKAIIPVHLYGQCSDMEKIYNIASSYSISIIEDSAQSLGSECPFKNSIKKAGTIGKTGCFSFFPSKNLGCFGDGGMVVTNDDNIAEMIRVLRVHGGKPKYYHKLIGGNFRLDSIQAAVLKVKLPYLNIWNSHRQENAILYNDLFKEFELEIKPPSRIYFSKLKVKYDHIFNQYIIRVKNRDKLKIFLKDRGIGTEIYYPVSFHLQECLSYLGYKEGDFPESEKASKEVLALPIYPEIKIEYQCYIVKCIKEFYEVK